ncbi:MULTISPECIES: DUF2332 domain-containing protein [Microbacterium]|uniref:DUF2332 domain-containing protein n=1 Tax=Microbacterium TaxID=33882 RepID=UPI0027899059|nr:MULTISPECIES: DUF2332 domain-containing protein [Microbacterium]MDQ1076270.1 hypothetical protein [Microbacterium sp. SORGH_AS_0969]MDQ1116507.1 hypothetical protein [Microbacterium testaceum]
MHQDAVTTVVDRYRRFARDEAPGRSVLYAIWAERVVADAEVTEIVARIAETHRQPPLVFAVTRLLGAPDAVDAWAEWVVAHADALVADCDRRSVQTNEPQRCAALLPALSLIEGPIALLEVGASAGLCLYPDRYSYRYRRGAEVVALDPVDGPSQVVLECDLDGAPSLRMPEIVWRAGIDLNPLDARDAEDRAWLTGLVWPGEEGRRERIVAALDIAASDPPRLVEGDGAATLPALAADAPREATLVVTTPGVLAHVPRARRGDVIAAAQRAGRWITLDAPGLHDGWTSPPDVRSDGFALALDGEVLGGVDPLGAWVAWHPGIRSAAQ